MRAFFAMGAVAVAVAGLDMPAGAADRALLEPVRTYVEAANAGQRSRLISAFAANAAIVDEFSPYRFPAPHAAADWFDGFVADQKANGVTGAVIRYAQPKFVVTAGSQAYVVLPTTYTYKIHGKPAQETGSLVFTLVRRAAAWKIATMSWAKLSDTQP